MHSGNSTCLKSFVEVLTLTMKRDCSRPNPCYARDENLEPHSAERLHFMIAAFSGSLILSQYLILGRA